MLEPLLALVLNALFSIQLPAYLPGEAGKMTKMLRLLPLTWDTRLEFQGPSFSPAEPLL